LFLFENTTNLSTQWGVPLSFILKTCRHLPYDSTVDFPIGAILRKTTHGSWV